MNLANVDVLKEKFLDMPDPAEVERSSGDLRQGYILAISEILDVLDDCQRDVRCATCANADWSCLNKTRCFCMLTGSHWGENDFCSRWEKEVDG